MPQSNLRWMRALAILAAVSAAGAARAEPESDGARTIELRLQTASTIAGGALGGVAAGPGVNYQVGSSRSLWAVNLAAGAGAFVTSSVAIGVDLGLTVLHEGDTLTLFSAVPFVKFVTGLPERQTGFFIEPEVGFSVLSAGSTSSLFQAGGWLGAHLWVNRSIAFLIGPSATYLRALSGGGGDTGFIGVRLGVATYLP